MRVWMLRLGLSLMVAVGVCTDRLPAQLQVVPAVPYEPAYHPPFPSGIAERPPAPPSSRYWQGLLNRHGMGCEANRHGTCGSFHSDFRFIFGSCRDFFGERCNSNQPHGSHRWGAE